MILQMRPPRRPEHRSETTPAAAVLRKSDILASFRRQISEAQRSANTRNVAVDSEKVFYAMLNRALANGLDLSDFPELIEAYAADPRRWRTQIPLSRDFLSATTLASLRNTLSREVVVDDDDDETDTSLGAQRMRAMMARRTQ